MPCGGRLELFLGYRRRDEVIANLLIAATAILPLDRLSMADRLFNRGDYSRSLAEYSALVGEKSIDADELLYRLGECNRMLGNNKQARASFSEMLDKFPLSKYADKARLAKAFCGTEDEQRVELKILDADKVEPSVRAAALYRLGILTDDAAVLSRAIKVDPKGRYAAYANFHRASILSKSSDAKERRVAVSALLEIAFGADKSLAPEALNLAALQCYSDKRYSEASSLFRRYLKLYASGKHATEARRMAAWSEYLSSRYTGAIELCGDGNTDDLAYLKAVCTHALGDGDGAVVLFRKYLEDYPEGRYREGAELPLARIGFSKAEKEGDALKALEFASRAYSLSSMPADGLRLAWAYERANKISEAAAEYAKIAKANPKTETGAEALYRLALIDLRAGRWSAAELSLAEALASGAIGSREAMAYYWRGVAAMHLEHESEGAGFLRKALEAGLPMDELREARLMLADWDLKSDRTSQAKDAYSKLVAEGACDRMSAAKILQVGKMLGGENSKICAKALVANGSAQWRQAGYVLLGMAEEDAQSYAAALDAYRKAMAEKAEVEDLAAGALRLGVLEGRAGNLDASDVALKRAIALNAANPRARAQAYLALASNCVARKDYKGARGYATVVATLFSDSELCAEAEGILKSCPEDSK